VFLFQVCRPPRTYPVLRFTILQFEFPPRITSHSDLRIIVLRAVKFYLYLSFDPKNIYHFSPFSGYSGILRIPREYSDHTPILLGTPAFAGRLGQERPLFFSRKLPGWLKFIIPCSYRLPINDVESSLTEALRRSRD